MQCPNCQFENMPGLATCVRCSAPLTVASKAQAIDFIPPRAGGLKRWRRLAYPFNRFADAVSMYFRQHLTRLVPSGCALTARDHVAAFLSAIPGLGHWYRERPRAAWIALGVWLFLLFLTLNLCTSLVGGILLGLLFSWHASVVFDASAARKRLPGFRSRLMYMLVVMFLTAVGYWGAGRGIRTTLDLAVTAYAFPHAGLAARDTVLVHRFRDGPPADLVRGSIVALPPRTDASPIMISHGYYLALRYREVLLGTLVALPLDNVVAGPDSVTVNGVKVPEELLPEGFFEHSPGQDVTIDVGPDDVLVLFPPAMGARWSNELDRNPEARTRFWEELYRHGFTFPKAQLYGRPVAVYLPLLRRKFISTQEAP